MRFSDGRIPIAPPGNPDDFIPGDPLAMRPDRSGRPETPPTETRPVENTRYSHKDFTLYIQFGRNEVTTGMVNIRLSEARKKGLRVDAIVLFVSQDTLLEQRRWLEKQGYEQQMQTNPASSQFIMRQCPAKDLED